MTDLAVLKKEAKNKKTSASRLEELARHVDSSVQLAVAGNPNTPAATLEYLGQSTKLSVLKALAKNPNTPLHVLERLARHRQDTVRQAVAESAQIPETIALEMLNDASERTRWYLIQHSYRFQWDTRRLFECAARDPSSLVRMTVAERTTSSDILEGFVDDENWWVVAYTLGNHALALSSLTAKLEMAFEVLNRSNYWLNTSYIVERRDLPVYWLERFSKHPNAIVRQCIVKNPNTPRSVLLQLARDPDWAVLKVTATLPDLPEDVYLGYAKHREVFVRSALVANPAIPQTVLEQLAHDQDPNVASKAQQRLE